MIDVAKPKWRVTGGTIDSAGLYLAGQATGVYNVRVSAGETEALAEVRIQKEDTPKDKRGGKIRWNGVVPPQKWMNFYTKVISRLVSSPELKLEVTFVVPVEGDHVKAKVNEARAGLRELGLNDEMDNT